MADAARSSFNSQLASVMESLLAAAVCEISRIFEGSLSDSWAEVQRGREEVALLNRKLGALEGQLQEASSVRDAGVTFDPCSLAQDECPELGKSACLLEEAEAGAAVKAELQVKELESASLTQECAELPGVRVKQEAVGEDAEPPSGEGERSGVLGGTSQLCPTAEARLEAVADGAVRWAVLPEGACPGPVLAQKSEEGEGLSAAGLECVPCQPRSPWPKGVAKHRGNIVLGGDMVGGARMRLSPTPSHTPRNGHTHRPALDHTPRNRHTHRPALDHAPKNGHSCINASDHTPRNRHTHRPALDHAHRKSPDHVVSSSPPAPVTRLPWDSPPQPGHPHPGGQEEGRFEPSPSGATQSCHLTRRPNPWPVATARPKPPPGAPSARERPYGCAFCGKAFFYPSQQRRHLLRHTGERRYPCAQCEKSFVTPSERSVHVRVHTGEKPYCCLQCGKRFNRTGNLRAHQRDVHLGKRPFSCAECGKTFAQKGNLRTHQQRVHQAPKP